MKLKLKLSLIREKWRKPREKLGGWEWEGKGKGKE